MVWVFRLPCNGILGGGLCRLGRRPFCGGGVMMGVIRGSGSRLCGIGILGTRGSLYKNNIKLIIGISVWQSDYIYSEL
jgi:hypothetical protein